MRRNLYLILLFTCLSSAVFAKKLTHQDLNKKIEDLQLQLNKAKEDDADSDREEGHVYSD